MRSPRITRAEKLRTTTGKPEVRLRNCEAHVLGFEHHLAGRHRPARSAGARCRSRDRRSARSARIAINALTRPSSRVRRAFTPRRSHTSSVAIFLSNFALRQLLVGEPLLFLALERGVVAGPRRQPAAIELDDPRRQPLEERAIVRHEDDGAAILGEEGFEPGDRLDVEVIGGLVEQQQIGLADQRARQQHAALPSAGERVDDRVRRQRQPRHHHVGLVMPLPFIVRIERAEAFADHIGDGAIRRQRHVLHQPRDANAGLAQHQARNRAADRRSGSAAASTCRCRCGR